MSRKYRGGVRPRGLYLCELDRYKLRRLQERFRKYKVFMLPEDLTLELRRASTDDLVGVVMIPAGTEVANFGYVRPYKSYSSPPQPFDDGYDDVVSGSASDKTMLSFFIDPVDGLVASYMRSERMTISQQMQRWLKQQQVFSESH